MARFQMRQESVEPAGLCYAFMQQEQLVGWQQRKEQGPHSLQEAQQLPLASLHSACATTFTGSARRHQQCGAHESTSRGVQSLHGPAAMQLVSMQSIQALCTNSLQNVGHKEGPGIG